MINVVQKIMKKQKEYGGLELLKEHLKEKENFIDQNKKKLVKILMNFIKNIKWQ